MQMPLLLPFSPKARIGSEDERSFFFQMKIFDVWPLGAPPVVHRIRRVHHQVGVRLLLFLLLQEHLHPSSSSSSSPSVNCCWPQMSKSFGPILALSPSNTYVRTYRFPIPGRKFALAGTSSSRASQRRASQVPVPHLGIWKALEVVMWRKEALGRLVWGDRGMRSR